MNDGLKQRIIGALVLVALGVIFIPVIFDRERIEPVDRTSKIPPMPNIELEPLPEVAIPPRPKSEALVAPISGDFRVEAPQEKAVAPKKTPPPVAKAKAPKPTPSKIKLQDSTQAWVLQVASYQSEARANQVRDELYKQGLKAFTKKANTSAGVHFRLYIGPSIQKDTLIATKVKIDKQYRVNSMLLTFKP